MRISVKCSQAVHILLMISAISPHSKVTSDLLASSVGCNPVDIRKILGDLKKAEIIHVTRGPGGAYLLKEPADISLLDIYSAVDAASLDELIGLHRHPASECPFGGNIYELLSGPYAEIGDAIREKMAAITLKQLLDRLAEMEPGIYEPM